MPKIILVVDDIKRSNDLMTTILRKRGSHDITTAYSAKEAYECIGLGESECNEAIDLILLDIAMPEVDGMEVLRRIKNTESLARIPIIMITGGNSKKYLKQAFDLGAVDFVSKPFRAEEFTSRVDCALRLKEAWDKQLELAKQLEMLTLTDELTGVTNRRGLNQALEKEWRRAMRREYPISLIMIDIDFFKGYNDTYGHIEGDECLKRVTGTFSEIAKRPYDLVARYGGEEFAILLPEIMLKNAYIMAEKVRTNVESLKIEHTRSSVSEFVTISLGLATIIPYIGQDYNDLIRAADEILYQAKEEGRNRIKRMDGQKDG